MAPAGGRSAAARVPVGPALDLDAGGAAAPERVRAHARVSQQHQSAALCCTLRSSMESAASPLVGSRMRSAPRAHEVQPAAHAACSEACKTGGSAAVLIAQLLFPAAAAKQQHSRTHATMSAPDPSSAAAQPAAGADQVQRRRGEAQVWAIRHQGPSGRGDEMSSVAISGSHHRPALRAPVPEALSRGGWPALLLRARGSADGEGRDNTTTQAARSRALRSVPECPGH
jgi:hypothetical protein